MIRKGGIRDGDRGDFLLYEEDVEIDRDGSQREDVIRADIIICFSSSSLIVKASSGREINSSI